MHNYYQKRQIIAKIDREENIIGGVEKWEAHKNGILHKGITIALIYKKHLIVQHRKHPAFDGVFDITSSSHPLFVKGELQTSQESSYECLKREWGLNKSDVSKIRNLGAIYYRNKDNQSIFTEHEICDVLIAQVKKLPTPNFDYAYGFSLVKIGGLKNGRFYQNLAPWVKKAIEENKL